MNMQCSLIQEFMFYKFELSNNAAEAIKTICRIKGEDTIDHSTVELLRVSGEFSFSQSSVVPHLHNLS